MKSLVLVASMACSPAMAQIYKCPDASGRTVMQQMPCAGGEAVKVAPTGPTSSDMAEAHGKAAALCEEYLRTVPAWKDAKSLQVTNVRRVGFTTIKKHGTTLAVVQYRATVNGKNSYGAYAGEKPAACYLDPSETRVLDLLTF